MFSSVGICSNVAPFCSFAICPMSGDKIGIEDSPKKIIVLCVADVGLGLALVIVGSISISGILPCGAIGGGVMIGVGCFELVAGPPIAMCNGCCNLVSHMHDD